MPVLQAPHTTLMAAPLELGGEWGESPTQAACKVVSRMREVCLSGVTLLSDQQPEKLRVDDHATGPPHIWLHADHPETAWIIVDIGARDWCKLAYQFGHELGHVLCNSWRREAKPEPPSQWLEEAMVEGFSIRGLGLLAGSWEHDPPFAGDALFAQSIRRYRQDLVDRYRTGAGQKWEDDVAAWFWTNRDALERGDRSREEAGPVLLGKHRRMSA